MRITALIENTTGVNGCAVEHGLSLYIETNSHNILFDAGRGSLFASNASKMGIALDDVNFAVLSHGHDDHAGGMSTFFRLNKNAPLYTREGYDRTRYASAGRYAGVEPLLIGHPRVRILKEEIFQPVDGVKILCFPDRECVAPVYTSGMMELSGGYLRPESFLHEQYMLINENGHNVLFTGCSHRNILNIMHWTKNIKIDAVIGGFHLKDFPVDKYPERIDETAARLMEYPPLYWTCHCTGIPQFRRLKETMGDRLHYLSSGETIIL